MRRTRALVRRGRARGWERPSARAKTCTRAVRLLTRDVALTPLRRSDGEDDAGGTLFMHPAVAPDGGSDEEAQDEDGDVPVLATKASTSKSATGKTMLKCHWGREPLYCQADVGDGRVSRKSVAFFSTAAGSLVVVKPSTCASPGTSAAAKRNSARKLMFAA